MHIDLQQPRLLRRLRKAVDLLDDALNTISFRNHETLSGGNEMLCLELFKRQGGIEHNQYGAISMELPVTEDACPCEFHIISRGTSKQHDIIQSILQGMRNRLLPYGQAIDG